MPPEDATQDPAVVAQEPIAKPVEAKGPTSFRDRARGVLFLPEWAFAHHDATWGWAKPWLLVAAAGILVGVMTLARIDVSAVFEQKFAQQMDQMSRAERAAIDSNPQAKEGMETWSRFMAFGNKAWYIVGPPISGLVGLIVWGGALFVLTRFVRGPDTPIDLLRCLSLAAYVQLVDLIHYAAIGLGVLTGNPAARTGAGGLVSDVTNPLLHTVLSRVDPLHVLFYGLLAVGLHASLRLPRRKAIGAAIGAYLAVSLLLIGFVAGSLALKGMFGATS